MMNPFEIAEIKGREILDCRGDPTLQVDVITREGLMGRADVPSGRSKGKYEAFELRDGGRRFHGRGVLKAVKKVNEIVAPSLKGHNVTDQKQNDKLLIELDGTENKSKLGANTTTGVSLAIAKAAANALKMPLYRHIGGSNAHILPVPLFDLIEGGKLAATELDFQEHHVI
ncbi:MAG: phosphopyruvate hydratase, partial [Candidatus Bathyarchaeota archaeon]|nr:phosphopyruvate hydratase [Candidatus Bathyarchaeota archaeon]